MPKKNREFVEPISIFYVADIECNEKDEVEKRIVSEKISSVEEFIDFLYGDYVDYAEDSNMSHPITQLADSLVLKTCQYTSESIERLNPEDFEENKDAAMEIL